MYFYQKLLRKKFFLSFVLISLSIGLLVLYQKKIPSIQAQTTTADWAMFMHDPQHTGNTTAVFQPSMGNINCKTLPDGISPCIQVKWKKSFPEWANGLAQPVVVGQTYFQPIMDGKLYAWNTDTGAERWVFDAGSPIAVTPAVANGKIFFGDFSGKIYALDTTTKQQIFTIQTGGPIYSSPVVFQENSVMKVCLGSNDGKMYCFNGDTGQLLFSFDTGGSMIYSNPAYYQGRIYFAAENMSAYAVNSTTGQQVWKKTLTGGSNRGNHPIVMSTSNTVLFYSVPAHNNTGMGLKDKFFPYALTGGPERPDGSAEMDLPQLLQAYQGQVTANPMTKSVFLFDVATGNEVTSFTAGSTQLSMIPLNIWYANGQNYPTVEDNQTLLFSAFGGLIRLNTSTRQFSIFTSEGMFMRGDEYSATTIAGNYFYSGFGARVARLNRTNAQREQLLGSHNGELAYLDTPTGTENARHWQGFTGDGGTQIGQYFIIANGRAFWNLGGWIYGF